VTGRPPTFDVVVPTIGRPSLSTLLDALVTQWPDGGGRILVVDDRPAGGGVVTCAGPPVAVLPSGGRGPAAARNVGWRAATAPWVVFLDDDVVPAAGWARQLLDDLATAGPGVAAIQGGIRVPRSARPTDRERDVGRLEAARFVTADVAVRRPTLERVAGFDERFRRAYREDTDLELRLLAAGASIRRGRRTVLHPATPAPWWSSIRAQRGNADDALLRALHGPAALDRGRRPRHQLVAASAAVAVTAALARRRRLAALTAGAWLAGTLELAWARIRPGPRGPREVIAMVATSVAIPFAATAHWWRGRWRWREVARRREARRWDRATGNRLPTGSPRGSACRRPEEAAMPSRDPDPDTSSEEEMDRADEANGEGRADRGRDGAANDTEARYGHDESPA
jgi:hypothetical protein